MKSGDGLPFFKEEDSEEEDREEEDSEEEDIDPGPNAVPMVYVKDELVARDVKAQLSPILSKEVWQFQVNGVELELSNREQKLSLIKLLQQHV